MTTTQHLATLHRYYTIPTLKKWIAENKSSKRTAQIKQVIRWRRVLATLEKEERKNETAKTPKN